MALDRQPGSPAAAELKLLLVTAEVGARQRLSALIQPHFVQVTSCDTCAEARLLLRALSPDVVVVDPELADGCGLLLGVPGGEPGEPGEPGASGGPAFLGYARRSDAGLLRQALEAGFVGWMQVDDTDESLSRQLQRAIEQQRAQRQRSEDELLRELLRTSVAAITVLDADGLITYANPAARQVLGLDTQEITSRRYNTPAWRSTDFEGQLLPDHELPFMRVKRTGKPIFEVQHAIEWPSGERRYLSISGAPLHDNAGDFTGAVFSIVDITRAHQTELVLRQNQQELEQRVAERTAAHARANEQLRQQMLQHEQVQHQLRRQQAELTHVTRLHTMGELASGLAHELNQPLTAIGNFVRGSLRRLESDDRVPPEVLQALRAAGQQTERAGQIIRRLRAMVYKREPQRSVVDLRQLVANVQQLLAYELREQGFTFQTHLPDTPAQVLGDAVELEQVLINLLRNGLEASAATDPARRILVVTIAELNDNWRLRVRDHGTGLPGAVADQLFTPFRTTKREGMGMGLSISHTIIRNHGGSITLTNAQPGPGAVAQIVLPRLQQLPSVLGLGTPARA